MLLQIRAPLAPYHKRVGELLDAKNDAVLKFAELRLLLVPLVLLLPLALPPLTVFQRKEPTPNPLLLDKYTKSPTEIRDKVTGIRRTFA